MKVKIIDSKPIDNKCSEITDLIGKIFDGYLDEKGIVNIAPYGNKDIYMRLFDGEYEIIEE